MRNADKVVTVAKHLKKEINEKFEVDAEVIYSGLDSGSKIESEIIKRKYQLKGDDYVYFIGRIDPIKRVHWLVELSEFLPEGIKLVISGGAQDESMKKYLTALKKKSRKKESIVFTGPVTGKEKIELLSNSVCILLPSINEGLPITILEAASYSKSCIVSSIPAHTEVIENGVNGFLFPNGNKQAFFDLTLKLLSEDRHKLNQIGQKAKKMAVDKFDWDLAAKEYEKLFSRLISG